MKKIKWLVVALVLVVIVSFIWSLSSSLVELGGSSEDFIKNNTESNEEVIERDEIDTLDEEPLKNQVGSASDKSVQCVYDFFEETFPGEGFADKDYEIKKLDDGSYCVNVDDWYIFVKNESNISYPYKFTKSSDFTDYEKETLLGVYKDSEFLKEGDLYEWKVD